MRELGLFLAGGVAGAVLLRLVVLIGRWRRGPQVPFIVRLARRLRQGAVRLAALAIGVERGYTAYCTERSRFEEGLPVILVLKPGEQAAVRQRTMAAGGGK